jgi:hypothetical protein
MDYLDNPVIHGCGNLRNPSLHGYNAVDRIDLARFSLLDILKHAWFQFAMLLHGEGNQQEGNPLLERIVVTE